MAGLGIRDVDLEETFARSSGPGGQNVNKVATAVTLRHRPSGVSVTVQDSRSQAVNRRLARERLLDAIESEREKRRAAEIAEREKTRRRKSPRPAALDESGLLRCAGTSSTSGGGSRLFPSKANAAKVWVVYQENMRKTLLVAGCVLLLGTTVIASDFAADPLNFTKPQQDLIDNVGEMLRETNELESCREQQQQALQRFLALGLSYNAAALMAHEQYPCD
jgi:hypothetical protein